MSKRNYPKYTNLAFNVYNNAKICVKCYTTEKICIHHKDNNPLNNEENNLQILCLSCHRKVHWITEETRIKIIKSKTWVKQHKARIENAAKTRLKKIKQYSLEWVFIKEWNSISEASKILWIKRCNIWAACNGKRNKAWWFKWKFILNS